MQHNIANYLNQWQSETDRVLYRQFTAASQDWQTVSTVAWLKDCAAWQAAFRAAGLVAGDRVAICARNSMPGVQVDIAALGMGLVVVPLYIDDSAGNVAYCASHSGAKLFFYPCRICLNARGAITCRSAWGQHWRMRDR